MPLVERRSPDVIGNAEKIIPALGELMAIDRTTVRWNDEQAEEKQRRARKAVVNRRFIKPFWGGLESAQLNPDEQLPTEFSGKKLEDKIILDHVPSASLLLSVARGTTVLVGTANARVEDSLIISEVALGTARGDNGPVFSSQHLALMTQISEGIHLQKPGQIIAGLRGISRFFSSYERGLFAKIYPDSEKDTLYLEVATALVGNTDKGKKETLASAVKVVDKYYYPAIQGGQTNNVFVGNSVVYGRSDVLSGVLGGEVEDCIIASLSSPIARSHVRLTNTFVVTEDDWVFFEKGRAGDPDRAKDAVEAARELPAHPLISFG